MLTRLDVADQAATLADMLDQRGIGKGSSVALLADNCPQWGAAYFGVLLAGSALVPLDVKLKHAEIANILQRSGAKLLVTSSGQAAKAHKAAEGNCDVILLDDIVGPSQSDGHALARALKRHTPRGDDLAVISFTSGTTGDPKGIMLTHANIASNVTVAPRVMAFRPDDNFLSVLPLNHLFEQTLGMVLPFHGGARVTYPQSLNPRVLVEAMHNTHATVAVIVPAVARLFHKRATAAIAQLPAWKRALTRCLFGISAGAQRLGIPVGPILLRGIRKGFGSHMRVFFSGGAALDNEIAWFFRRIGLPIMQGYGLSETSPLVAVNTPGCHRVGSVGKPIDDVTVRIDPRDGCEPGAGEILIHGPNVMAGYFQDAPASEAVLDDGWLRTGDLGRLDRDGYLYVTGRCKDVIIAQSGKNVYPNEIEAEIAKCPDVGEVSVVGMIVDGASGRGEDIVAIVTASSPGPCADDEPARQENIRRGIRAACVALADYKRPKYFVLWEGQLPRTPTLKVKKRELIARVDRDMLLPL